MVALALCRGRCTCGSTRNGIVRSRRGGRAWSGLLRDGSFSRGTLGLPGTATWPGPRRAFYRRPEERPTSRSRVSDRDGDELCRVIRLQPHQHSALAILMGVADGITHVRRGRNFLPADIEDDVAGLEAVLGGKPIGIDLGHNYPLRATAGDLSGRSEH